MTLPKEWKHSEYLGLPVALEFADSDWSRNRRLIYAVRQKPVFFSTQILADIVKPGPVSSLRSKPHEGRNTNGKKHLDFGDGVDPTS